MTKPDEFPQKGFDAENTKEARLARLKKGQRERQLSDVCQKFWPLIQEGYALEFYESDQFYGFNQWEDFFKNFGETVKTLISLDYFGDNQELKKECQEVSVLLSNKDRSQSKRYSDLIIKLQQFFMDNKVFVSKLHRI